MHYFNLDGSISNSWYIADFVASTFFSDAKVVFSETLKTFLPANTSPGPVDFYSSSVHGYNINGVDIFHLLDAAPSHYLHLTIGSQTDKDWSYAMLQVYTPLGNDVYTEGIITFTSPSFINDNLAPVPEPATMLLFCTDIGGLVGSRLRRKKK